MIQQTTPINLPTPRTPLIRVPMPGGGELLGYPTREFIALLRQFTVRVGGPADGIDLVQAPEDVMGAQPDRSMFSAGGDLVLLSMSGLQEVVQQVVAQELAMQRSTADHAIAYETTIGADA